MYKDFYKRILDFVLSAVGILIFAFPMLIIAAAIKLEDSGPVLFKQKRVGKKCDGKISYFTIWKFRSMRISAPTDTPTHLLENPEQHLTRVGKFIRRFSLDELPQIYQVFTAHLSVVGPRPALWTQTDLVTEREKYGANDVKPGITGWAQINGRDELEIKEKAKLDGEYVDALNAGGWKGFYMDIRCLCGTILSVIKAEGVVEGGTGEIQKKRVNGNEKNIDHRIQ